MNKTIVILIVLVLSVAVGAFLVTQYASDVNPFSKSEEIGMEVMEEEGSVDDTGSRGATTDEEIAAEVKAAIVAKHGGDADNTLVTVNQVVADTYASGSVGPASGGPGGGAWFAKLVDGEWELVWDGNGSVMCEDLEGYGDFPSELIPECWDEPSGQLIVR